MSLKIRPIFNFIGEHKKSDGNEFGEQRIKVKRIINHEKYIRRTLSYDFALLELETEAEITDTVRTICLPKKFQNDEAHFDQQTCYVTGWGQIGTDMHTSDVRVSFLLLFHLTKNQQKFERVE